MTGPAPDYAYRRAYPLPAGFTVEFALSGARLTAEWSPRVPKRAARGKLLRAYRAARNDFLASLGVGVLVIET